MSFRLHVSSDLEVLAELFRKEIYERVNCRNPLEPVSVTVQTQGMAVWLRQYLSRKSKIAMNLEMPFLRASIERELKQRYAEAEQDLYLHDQEQEVWQIFEWLSQPSHREMLPELQKYLQNDPDMRKRFQISREITKAFEQYRVYRPELLEKWREKESTEPCWQERIYRDLFLEEQTLDVYLNRFSCDAAAYSGKENGKTLSIFGISSMAPRFLNFFLDLSKFQEIHFFYLSPSEEYWEDAITRQQAKRQALPESVRQEIEENNNPLLTAFGGQGRAFFRELLKSDIWDIAEEHPMEYSEKGTLLGALQEDIRRNRNGLPGRDLAVDDSIMIESCHTRLREIQVLHDRVLREIENGREPGEILITAPDIEQYVSSIDSVFGTGPLAGAYTIADRTLRQSGQILPDLLNLLSIGRSDYSSTLVFPILENDLILRKFRLERPQLEQIRGWCQRAGIRWGVDERTREEQCGLKFDLFSWYHGIRRMLLGYAVKEDFSSQGGMPDLPLDFAEGKEAVPLGDFLDFLEELFRLRDLFSAGQKKTPQEWFRLLKCLPDLFFDPEGDQSAVQERAYLIKRFSELEYSSSGCHEEIPFQVISEILSGIDLPAGFSCGYLRGKITFCSMIPMRTIPMPFVAILGLNAGEFPRRDIMPGFNLIAQNPLDTDRSGNQEDRYLLLETILSARDKLHIFYLGQSSKDNSEIFPTPPLAELIRYLEQIISAGIPQEGLTVKHRLQPYAEIYFSGDAKYFTYSDAAWSASEGLRNISPRIFPELPAADCTKEQLEGVPLPNRISLDELKEFFKSTAAHYLHWSKGIDFQKREERLTSDLELFQPDNLQNYQLKMRILQAAAEQSDLDVFRKQLQKCGELPIGVVGEERYDALLQDLQLHLAESFLNSWLDQEYHLFSGNLAEDLEFSAYLPLTADRKYSIHFELGKKENRRMVNLWLNHLILSAAVEEYERTICVFQDKQVKLKRVEQELAKGILRRLTAMRELGKTELILFSGNISQNQKTETVTDSFRSNLIKSFKYDQASALLYKKEDFEEDSFCVKFAETAKLFYEGYQEDRSKKS